MDELVKRAAAITGLSEAQTRQALAQALSLMKTHADPAKMRELFAAAPETEVLAAEAPPKKSGGLLGGLMKGMGGAGGAALADAMQMGKSLMAQGVSADALKRLLPVATEWVRERTGRDLLGEALASVPGLSGYLKR
ncbi:MAG: hypothetical protein ACXW3D_09955 [Caulobacteraceae bacterium]